MKRKISLVFLSMVLVLSTLLTAAFAISASAATELAATFELNDDGNESEPSTETKTFSQSDSGYTLTFDSMSKVYKAVDKTGKGSLKLGTSSVAGTFTFTVPNDITKVIVYCAARAKDAKVDINGSVTQLIYSSNSYVNGDYVPVEVDTSSNKTVKVTSVKDKDIRIYVDKIEFYKEAAPTNPDCQHANVETQTTEATCQKEGTSSKVCSDCGVTLETTNTGYAEHTYEGAAICTVCRVVNVSAVETEEDILNLLYALKPGESIELPFTLTGKITEVTYAHNPSNNTISVNIVVEGYEDKPVNCYKLTGEDTGLIKVDDIITVTGKLKNYNGTYEIDTGSLDSWTSICDHANMTEIVDDPDCVNDGSITEYCPDCDREFGVEVIPATGHTFTNSDACDACGTVRYTASFIAKGEEIDPIKGVIVTLPTASAPAGYTFAGWSLEIIENGTVEAPALFEAGIEYELDENVVFYAVYTYEEKDENATGGFVETALENIKATDVVVIVYTKSDGKSYTFVNSNGASAPTLVEVTDYASFAENVKWNIAYDSATGTFVIYVNGDASKWIYCNNSNNGVRVGTSDEKEFVIDAATGYIKNVARTRYLGLYNTQDLRCYTTTTGNIANQTVKFYVEKSGVATYYTSLYNPEIQCDHEETYDVIDPATCKAEGTKTVKCSACDEIVAVETLPVLESCNYVDGVCSMCGAIDPTNVGAILKALYALESGKTLPGTFTLTGEIVEIVDAYSEQYSNITVIIEIDGYEEYPVLCYRIKGEGADKLELGDTITVTGSLTNYSGKYEFTTGSSLDSWVDSTVVAIKGTALNVGVDLSFLYYVTLPVTENPADYSMQFVMNGKTYVATEYETDSGYYVFIFTGIAPQCMGDKIDATLLKNGEAVASLDQFAVVDYLAKLSAAADSDELKTLIADILEYGAAAQKYVGYKTDSLVNADSEFVPSTANPTEADNVRDIVSNDDDEIYFNSVGVRFDYVNSIFVKLTAPSLEGVSVTFNGKAAEIEAYGNGYIAYSDGISVLDFDEEVTVEIIKDDAVVASLKYSVNSYIFVKYDGGNAMADLAIALYRYGVSTEAFNNIR